MAEVKNVFIKSKMNKDLDDRLIPSGEYRDAMNIAVSKSESSDVGALENIVGNKIVVDFTSFLGVSNLTCIGFLRSEDTNTIFVFLTDNLKSTNTLGVYVPTANNFIVSYNVLDGTTQTPASLVLRAKGAYLNFYEGNPIYGVNLIENLLFWTDNRNQPRKIDISKPYTYYLNEDNISVATYNPYTAIELWQPSTLSTGNYETTMKDVVSEFLEDGGTMIPNVTTTGTQFTVDSGDIKGYPVVGDALIGGTVVANTTITSITPETLPSTGFIIDVNNSNTFTQNVEYSFNANPYYNSAFQGDPDYLTDIFARFSYRFQFEDNTYSIMAPYTQECFIPKQDGYFLASTDFSDPTIVLNEDQEQAYRSTVVDFMENKVNQIGLRITLPTTGQDIVNKFKIKNVQILYKESDAQAIQVVDTIPAATVGASAGTTDVYDYLYSSTKPFQTLPSSEIVRVYDKIPVVALGQEIISNRIVYSNFQTKHSPPASIDYNVNVSSKSSFSIDDTTTPLQTPVQYSTSIIEYPNHSLKQNRNYQVGFVLSDRYGRSSTTILSNDGTDTASGLSTIYSPYRNTAAPQQDDSASVWPGDSLKINVNNVIPVEPNMSDTSFYPGVYNGDVNSVDYNPLGWYSYKIVVKQNEQDYYNVYLPGILNGYPDQSTGSPVPAPFPTGEDGYTANIVLINDNINKVPRDLSEVGPEQRQFRSSVRLFGRVENNSNAGTITTGNSNKQYFPGRSSDTVVNIGSSTDSNMTFDTLGTNGQDNLYQIDTQPYIARLSTFNAIGQVTTNMEPFLAVYETEPTISRIDIYYETTTTGLVQDLNYVVENNTSIASGLQGFNFLLKEDACFYNGFVTGAPFTDSGVTIPSNLYPGLQGMGNVVDRPTATPANTVARFLKTDFQGDGNKLLGTTAVGASGSGTAIVSAVEEQPLYWRVTIAGGPFFGGPGTPIKFAAISKLNINGNFWPIDAGGTALEYSRIGLDQAGNEVFSVLNSNSVDVTDHFQIIRVAKGDIMLDGSTASAAYPQDTYYLATRDQYFLHNGFDPSENNFKFTFQLQETNSSGQPVDGSGNPTTASQFVISNNQLLNVQPVINNCLSQRVYSYQEGQGPSGPVGFQNPMVDLVADNGSNLNNLVLLGNGNFMYEDALTWTITNLSGPGVIGSCTNSNQCGPFTITNYQDPTTSKRYGRIVQDGSAIGAYNMTVRVTDSGGEFAECTTQYIFGETPLFGSLAGIDTGASFLPTGSSNTFLFTNSSTGWNNQTALADQGFVTIPPLGIATSMQAPARPGIGQYSNTTAAGQPTKKCTNCSGQTVPCSSAPGSGSTNSAYSNEISWVAPPANQSSEVNNNWQGISAGTAYIAVSMWGTNIGTFCSSGGQGENFSGGNSQKYIFGSVNIDYRLNSSSAWTPAVDLKGDICGGGASTNISRGSWEQNNQQSDIVYGHLSNNGFPYSGGGLSGLTGNWEINIVGQNVLNGANYTAVAQRVFAFDTVGEYRIITKNIESNNWWCNNTVCGGTYSGFNYFNDKYSIGWGDFYYDFGVNRAFKYIVGTVAGSSFGASVYAKEPFFRYVTQLYTDVDLTIPYTTTAGTRYLRTESSAGTNYSAAGNFGGGTQVNKWPFEFSNSYQSPVGAANRQDQTKRLWQVSVSATGAVSNNTPYT